jgi:MFS family permease
VGFPWAVRSIAFLVLALYLISFLALIDHQKTPPMVRPFFDMPAFVDAPFMMLSVASVFSAIAYYIPLLYLPLLTELRIPSIDPDMIFDLLAIVNGASAVGRLMAGLLAAAIGPTETVSISLVLGSLLLFCWIVVDSLAGTIVWAVFWGIVSGALVAVPGAFIPLFCPSLAVVGTRSGMYWVWVGLGMLIGSPIGGAIYDVKSTSKGVWRLQVFAGISMMIAAMLTIYPIIYLRRRGSSTARG